MFHLARIPEGLTSRAIRLAEGLEGFHVDFNQISEQARVILVSIGGDLIAAGEGPIMELVFDAQGKKIPTRYLGMIKNVHAADESNEPINVKLKSQAAKQKLKI